MIKTAFLLALLLTCRPALSAQAPVTALPYAETFSAPLGPEWVLDPDLPVGRVTTSVPAQPSFGSGGAALLMDAIQPGMPAVNEARLFVDLAASGARTLLYRAREEADDDDAIDGVFLGDGNLEVQVIAHAVALSPGWNEVEIDLVAAALAAGIATGPGFRIVFRQLSVGAVPADGIWIDDVRLLPPDGPGQANGPTAFLDVNGGLNANGLPAEIGRKGPFFASGSQLALVVAGEPNRAFVLLLGPLAPASASFGPVGILDLGVAPGFGDLVVLMDGATGTGPLDVLAHTGPGGSTTFVIGLHALPLGVLGSFQALVYDASSDAAHLTAAFELTVTP